MWCALQLRLWFSFWSPASSSFLATNYNLRLQAAGLWRAVERRGDSICSSPCPHPPKKPPTGCPTMDGRGVAGCDGWRRRLNEAVAGKKSYRRVKQRPRIGGGRCSEVARHRRPRAVVVKMPLEESRALATTPKAWLGVAWRGVRRRQVVSCHDTTTMTATIWFLRFPVMLWLFN